jgi:glycosyltransferase involved in cell wall biosynthesis
MNYIYNSADVYINLASNEGFGLGSAEALMTETPIIVNVTGGLQDQCGFKKEDGSYLTADDYVELGSNHRGKYKNHGEWVKPVFPSNISCQGSPLTPYIFDDRCQYEDAGDAIKYWYDKDPEEREKCGKLGKEFLLDDDVAISAKKMCERVIESANEAFDKFKPRKRYTMEVL